MTILDCDYVVTNYTAANIDLAVLQEVLDIQRASRFKGIADLHKGFLFTQWSKEELRDLLQMKSGVLKVCRNTLANVVIGYVLVSPISVFIDSITGIDGLSTNINFNELDSSRNRYLYQIGITDEFRRMGIGRHLVEKVMAENTEYTLYLDHMQSPYFNRASHEFFLAMGFSKYASIEMQKYKEIGSCKWLVMRHKQKTNEQCRFGQRKKY